MEWYAKLAETELAKKITAAFITEGRWKLYFEGLGVTLQVSLFAVIIGIVIGTIVAIMKLSTKKNGKPTILSHIANIYIDIIRGTPAVLQLRDQSGFPGMKVLEFAFDSQEPSDYLPHKYPRNSVCYTGTHDNMTMRQWFETASAESVAYAKRYMCLTEEEGLVWGVIRTAMASVSDLCVIQMQDLLNLGAEGRMNFPGTQSADNWTWRFGCEVTDPTLAQKIREMTRLYGRI